MSTTVVVYGLRVNQARVMRAMTVTAVMEALGCILRICCFGPRGRHGH